MDGQGLQASSGAWEVGWLKGGGSGGVAVISPQHRAILRTKAVAVRALANATLDGWPHP